MGSAPAVRTRECRRERASNSCAVMRLGGAEATVCSCDTDRCNGATASNAGRHFVAVAVATAAAVFVLAPEKVVVR